MKVTMVETGRTEEVNDSYGARLIEQGKAVPMPPSPVRETPVRSKRKAKAAAPDAPGRD